MRRTLPLAALLATAATTATAPAAAGAADELTRYAEARERWAVQDARDYSFRLRLQCFCPLREPVKIRVSDGKPRRPRSLRRFDTVEELFARVREQIERGLDVRYSARTGVPKDFSADPLPMAIDDEFTVRVRELRITRRG